MFYQLHHMGSGEYFKKETNENFSYPIHLHQCFELVIVTEGVMNISLSSGDFELKANEAILIFPNELHSLSSTKSKHILFIFSPKLIRAFSTKYQSKLPKARVIRPEQFIIDKLTSLDNTSSVIEQKGLLYTVASILEKETEFTDTTYDKKDLLMKIFLFVDGNFHTECALTALARSVGYDPSYLSRYFKRATGISYNSYVNACRLNHASYLLHNTDQSILECSIESGYRSLRTFNRNFKDYFGKTPGEYRENKMLR